MPSDAGADRTRVIIPADPVAVRQALCALMGTQVLCRLAPDARDAAQIVLAEALNNIVEHAYAQSPGEIEVTLDSDTSGLTCQILDAGLPLPGGSLPQGEAPLVCASADLPEGGFGWYLIRSLCRDLTYRRVGGYNLLSFRIESKQYAQ